MLRSVIQRTASRRLVSVGSPRSRVASRLYSQGPSQGNKGPSIPAMLAVASMGFAAYYTLVKSRQGQSLPRQQAQEKPSETAPANVPDLDARAVPAFSPEEVTVVFVLGGPGAGKGTQCDNLRKDFGFVHLSAGDLLRAEQKRPGSKYGELINHYIKEGLIVPMEVTIALLEQAMQDEVKAGNTRFLIDGFPRKMDQAVKFEEVVVTSKLVLYFECPEQVMLQRLLKRGENSGRVDDNIESIKKRFAVFKDTSFPVIEAYEKQDKVEKISCDQPVDQVYAKVKVIFEKMFGQH